MGSYLDKPITEKEHYESEAHGMKFGAAAMQGWRVEMEDAHTVIESIDPELEGHSFIAVYDGHGGHFAAIYCGQYMIDFVKKAPGFQEYKKTREVQHLEAAIKSAYLSLDAELKQQEEVVQRQDTSGCTAICAIITPTHVVVGNAGDSRGVLFNSGVPKQLSRDHKPYLDDERKRIEEAGGMVSMQRVDGDLALSRSIGDFQYKDRHLPPERQKVTAFPETHVHERSPDDEMLLLACDGVWDVCDNEEAGNILRAMVQEGEKRMALMAEELLDQCLLRYSKDNISAVLVAFPAFFERHHREGEGILGRRRRRQPQQQGQDGGGGGSNSNNNNNNNNNRGGRRESPDGGSSSGAEYMEEQQEGEDGGASTQQA